MEESNATVAFVSAVTVSANVAMSPSLSEAMML